MDLLLEAFVAASGDDAEEQLGVLLAAHASPVIGRVIAGRLGAGSSDADDVRAQVLLQLMLRLRQGRIEHTLGTIDAFTAYVAAATRHACDHLFRAKYPLRWRLRNRLRYALEHDRRFALKSPQGTWLGGPAAGCRGYSAPARSSVVGHRAAAGEGLLARLFDISGGPLG